MFNYKNDSLNTHDAGPDRHRSRPHAKADWQKAQDLIAGGHADRAALLAKVPAGAQKYVMGFVGAGNGTEVLNSVWLNK
jgi:hypothetical protein